MKKSQSTLKIHNITFSQQFTHNFNQETLRSRVKLGKTNNEYFLSKNNKQNSVQKKYDKHVHEDFNFKTLHPNKSCLLSLRKNEFNDVLSRYQSQSRLVHLNDAKPYLLIRKSSHNEIPHDAQHKNPTQAQKRMISQFSGRRYLKKITQKPLQPTIVQKKKLIINTSDKIFTTKVQNYFQFLKQAGKLHRIQVKFQNYKKFPTVIVGGGNNSKLVKDILKKRWWLKIKDKKSQQTFDFNQVNLVWTQIKVREFFQEKLTEQKNIHNHFEFNGQLGNKKQLFINLKSFYQSQNKDPFSIIPLTFNLKNTNDKDFEQFKDHFQTENQRHPSKSQLWIVKPGENSNRGQGITIHSQLEEIKKLIDKQNSQKQKQNQSRQSTFIIQKYIEKPFLYQKRKFDIRCYYLLVCLVIFYFMQNKKIKAYWYKQGYIRTSCFQYNCNTQNNENIFVHLTNDAVQKNNQNYGKFEEGNKIDFTTFKKYLNTKYPHQKYDFDNQIWSNIKSIALDSIKATYQKLKRSKKLMFQIFGLDFMIDQDFKPWLIEVNTNPCLQTTCPVLEKIIPKMLDDSFQLSLDLIFPPPETWSSSKKYLVPTNLKSGYELIFDEDKQNKIPQTIEKSCSL